MTTNPVLTATPRALRLLLVVSLTAGAVGAAGAIGPVGTALGAAPAHGAPTTIAGHVPCSGWDGRTDLPKGTTCRTVIVDGYAREYFLYTPAGLPAAPVPLVVMHHGSSGNGAQFARSSGWREQADTHKFIAAFPTGLQYFVTDDGKNRWSTKWNSLGLAEEIDATKRLADYPASAPWPADDVKFERQLIADVARTHPIDTLRIFASGFSNGSAFATRLATEMADTFAAVASSGGAQPDMAALARLGAAKTPPLWSVMGTADDRLLANISPAAVTWDQSILLRTTLRLPNYGGVVTDLGLDQQPCRAEVTASTITFGFCTPGWSASTTPEYRMTWVKDLTHRYPAAAATMFWKFFTASSFSPSATS